ncbi:DMT family transporter [Gordoniibacillus kamchatkensis]|uniref:DMT family transporter n=1 Tax=Gordoniibacillus kamchatkensis TaxID=1590651 RepID=UPI000AB4FDB4
MGAALGSGLGGGWRRHVDEASQGFKRLKPTLLAVLFGIISFGSLSQAMRSIPIGTAYAVWTGIGSAGSVLLGIFLWRDPFSWKRLALLMCIVAGVIGLKLG